MTKIIFTQTGRVVPEDSGKAIPFTFEAPPWAKAMHVSFDYSPLFLTDGERCGALVEGAVREYLEAEEPRDLLASFLERPDLARQRKQLRNLLNLIVSDPAGGFAGRWDYHESRKGPAVVGEQASDGFIRQPLAAGKWTLELEVYGIYTDFCDYRIGVSACDANEMTQMPGPRERRPVRPAVGGTHLRGEMHTHTTHSDGHSRVPDRVGKAASYGLDFLAITDHNTSSHFREMDEIDGFPLLKGYELTTFYGHLIAYNAGRFIPWHKDGRLVDMNRIADEVHAAGGVFSLVHPFSFGEPVCVGCRFRLKNLDFAKIDMLEVWSGKWDERFPEIKRTIAFWDSLLASGLRVTGVAGTDWHTIGEPDRYSGVNPMTFVLAKNRDAASILAALRQGRAYISVGPEIEMTLCSRNGSGTIGDKVRLRKGEKFSIDVSLRNANSGLDLRLLDAGKIVETRVSGGNDKFTFDRAAEGSSLFRIELWNLKENRPILLTNHIETEVYG